MAAGEPLGLVPAGLASRDTLRLEAGMPLYGHELGLDTYPVQAGLGRVVALTKEGDFVGRAAIEAGPRDGARVLVGLVSEGKRAGRAGYALFRSGAVDGDTEVGAITSGALSPTLGHPIAMAYVDAAVHRTRHHPRDRCARQQGARDRRRPPVLQEREVVMTDQKNLKFTAEHEWIDVQGTVATVGITAYAAEKLGDVVFVDLPKAGSTVAAGRVVGEIESTKSVGELFAPVNGTVVESNDAVVATPELVNSDPFGEGWLIKVEFDELPTFLTYDEYQALVGE